MAISLMLLFVMVLSVSATFAANDDSIDEIAVENDIAEEVVATDVDDSSDKLSDDSNVVTKDNFNDYFDEYGSLTSDADELVFDGDFSGLDVSAITIAGDKAVKFTGKNATFKNVQFMIMQSDVTIDGFNFITDENNEHTRLIWIGVDDYIGNIVLSNNNIKFVGPANSEAYAIYAGADGDMGSYCIEGLQIINNNITYVGNSDGTAINNVIRVNGDEEEYETSADIVVNGNNFDIQIPSIKVQYGLMDEAQPFSEAIVFYYCEDVQFIDNRVNVKYNSVQGSSDTIYVVSAYANSLMGMSDANVVINDNEINGIGYSHIYGIKVSSEGFEIKNNKLNMSADYYYANGINIEGPSSDGAVSNNTISVKAPTNAAGAVYGIYTYQMMAAVNEVYYENNTIDAEGYLACGMEINQRYTYIFNNAVTSKGNYTYGIVASIKPASYEVFIADNNVSVIGSNEGSLGTGDPILDLNSIAIDVLGNAIIQNNKVNSTSIGINVVEQGSVLIDSNDINVAATGNVDNYAISINDITKADISKNNITFVGKTDGNVVTNAVKIFEAPAVISDNKFDIQLPSAAVIWAADWTSTVITEGILIDYSNGLEFRNNNITLNYNDIVGGYDTIYAVDIKNSANAIFDNNNLDIAGHTYMYGVLISGDNFTVSNNNITSSSDIYYANCIDVEGPATGVIKNNKLSAIAPTSSYPVYGAMSNGDVSVNITDNEIYGEAYLVYGVQIGGKDIIVKDNNITAIGNHTIGVGTHTDNLKVIGNTIIADASNVGDLDIWETMGTDSAAIKVTNGIVEISDNTMDSTSVGIKADGPIEVTISNCEIDVTAVGDVDNYAVYVDGADKFTMTDNNVTFDGASNGTTISNAMHIVDSGAVVTGNDFDITVPAADVVWGADWSSTVISEGIVFDSCDDLKFENNTVNLDYGDVIGAYDTIYAIDVLNSNNAVIKDNEIDASGNQYIYGIKITGDNFTIDNNNISTDSNYYANGIDVEGPATGVISNNNINAVAENSAYPIYSGMNYQPVSVNITGNDISGDAYYVVGVELGGQKALVENNTIDVSGNHTIGIGSAVDNLTVNNNNILSDASNIGDESIWDSMGTDSTGIKVARGSFSISNNTVATTGDYAADLGDSSGNITNNKLSSAKGAGDDSISGTGDVNSTGNPATGNERLKVIMFGVDLTKVYGSADQFVIKVLDENGKPVVGKTISFALSNGEAYTNVTDANGLAKIDINLVKGEYFVNSKFSGDDVYAMSTAKTNITVNPKPTAFTAPNTSVLLTAVKKGSTYKITLKDNEGKALANQKITVNGKEFTTDKNGVVNYKLSASKAGTQKLTVKFAGDDKYAETTKTATIKINKEATKLTAKNKKFKAKKKTKKYKVTLKDSKGKAISKVKVTIKVGKKTFKAKTNAKGKATFKIKKLTKKGTYKSKVKFAGNDLYNAVTKTVKIKVKK